ncbi:MAG TPA: DUF2189 domain-containing protein [Paracoccaceae bacterium]
MSWVARVTAATGAHLTSVGEALGGAKKVAVPQVQRITYADLRLALRLGIDDFATFRTDVIMICVFYPVAGAILAWVAFDRELLPILFPMISGFALIGPVAAVGLYEMSRRHEKGLETSWADAFGVLRSPAFGAIFVLGLALFMLFAVWLLVASWIYGLTMGPEAPASIMSFARDVVGTTAGWTMIVVGMAVGFCFAVTVLVVSVVSFPLLLDRNVGVPMAVITSIRVARTNPGPVAAWGLIVAGLLVLGSVPLFLGLIVVMPILGHATWHLYRRAVAPAEGRSSGVRRRG